MKEREFLEKKSRVVQEYRGDEGEAGGVVNSVITDHLSKAPDTVFLKVLHDRLAVFRQRPTPSPPPLTSSFSLSPHKEDNISHLLVQGVNCPQGFEIRSYVYNSQTLITYFTGNKEDTQLKADIPK